MAWRGWVAATAILWSSAAWGTEYYIEAPPSRDKSAAQQWIDTVSSSGQEARLVRRFRAGGWEYVVRIDGLTDATVAGDVAASLATRSLQTLSVYRVDGDQAVLVTTHAPKVEGAASPEDAEPNFVVDPAVAAVLGRAVAAHGGDAGGMAALAASRTLLFEYRRVVPNGPTVRHTYAARGSDLSLQTRITDGDGMASRTWTQGGSAWLVAGQSTPAPQDVARAREVLGRFSPEAVLSFPLGFAKAASERSEFKRLQIDGVARVHDRPCDVLRYPGDRSSSAFVLAIDQQTGWVHRVTFVTDAGEITHEFSEWHTAAPGVVIPRKMETWRATARIDEVYIEKLDLAARLPEEWFAAP
jgi:hypothetical protein